MLFFLSHGYRVIAHDRRGHGRSTDTGNDMDTYVADVMALTDHLDLRNAVHIGQSRKHGALCEMSPSVVATPPSTSPRQRGLERCIFLF